jgi:hypothetical protein
MVPFKGASGPPAIAVRALSRPTFAPFRPPPPSSDFSRLRPPLLSLYSHSPRLSNNLLSSTMVHPLQHQFLATPHITPHIHHTKYAHGPENDTPNQCTSPLPRPLSLGLTRPPQSSAATSSISQKPASTWRRSISSATRPPPSSTRTPSGTRAPSSPPPAPSSISPGKRQAGAPKTSA